MIYGTQWWYMPLAFDLHMELISLCYSNMFKKLKLKNKNLVHRIIETEILRLGM